MSFYTFQQQNAANMKYKAKLKKLKKNAENLVFENAALCDQVAQIQENILYVKEERRFLMKKLLERENLEDVNNGAVHHVGNNASGSVSASGRKPYKKRNASEQKSKKSSTTAQQQHQNVPEFTTEIHDSSQSKQIVQTISVDKNGQPIYPIQMGALTIHNLGKVVCDRPGYHTENWIYPVGFVSTRIYGHIKEPERKCVYTCKIIANGDFPRFEIIPDSDMDYVIAGPTPDLCHAALIQTINNSTDIRNIEIHPQGELFFGLAHPTVMTLLQTSTDVTKCKNFKSFTFDFFSIDNETDPSINYEALQKHIARSTYHTVLEVKEEPPDELFDQKTSDSGSRPFNDVVII